MGLPKYELKRTPAEVLPKPIHPPGLGDIEIIGVARNKGGADVSVMGFIRSDGSVELEVLGTGRSKFFERAALIVARRAMRKD